MSEYMSDEHVSYGLALRHPAAPARHRSLPGRACLALKPRQAAEPPLSPGSMLYVLYVLYPTRQAAEPPLSPGSLLYVLYVLYLTRQAAEPPLSPGSMLYVLYVLYLTRQQRKITEASKKLEMKKLYQVLVVIDDFADTPQLHKPHGALDTLFIRGRRMQKLRLISAAVRVNMQFLCCWRLRNQHELDAVIEELSALLPKEQLYRLYEQATREPDSFLFVYYLKPRNEMFYKRFEERFALEKDADGSGAQLPGPEAVRQLHADQREV